MLVELVTEELDTVAEVEVVGVDTTEVVDEELETTVDVEEIAIDVDVGGGGAYGDKHPLM